MVELTGWRNGLLNELLLIVDPDISWEDAKSQIMTKLSEQGSLAAQKDGQLTIDFGLRAVPKNELEDLVETIKRRSRLLTVAVVSPNSVTREAAIEMSLNVYLMQPGSSREENVIANSSNALYLTSTVRSGQRIVHSGHLIVSGDVNAGAEVVAEGDILVFGTLRGLAHAGSQGNEKAKIVAGNMRPEQLRIAEQIARAPEDSGGKSSGVRQPEVARIENGVIQVSPA